MWFKRCYNRRAALVVGDRADDQPSAVFEELMRLGTNSPSHWATFGIGKAIAHVFAREGA
jgi:hypothetical protein